MEDFEGSDSLEIDQLSDFNRLYLDQLVQFVGQETGRNHDYHKYHHYVTDELRKTWTEEEMSVHSKEIGMREFACPRTCRFCGCIRRKLKIRTRKVKRVKRKYYILICKFCGKSTLINKLGTNLAKAAERLKQKAESSNSESPSVKPRTRFKAKPKAKPEIEVKPEVVKPTVKPIVKPKKIEKFNQDDTLKQLNFLLKGGNGGKKLNFNQLQKSKLMDLLM